MFGSEILDIIIGLIFVYLLLSLVCSAINEYIASIINKRGKVLVQGIETLLKDSGVTDAFYAHPLMETIFGKKEVLDRYLAREKYVLKQWRPGFRWIYRLYSWFRDPELRHYRIPSYLPARTFALALVDASGFNRSGQRDAAAAPAATRPAGTQPAAAPVPANPSSTTDPAADPPADVPPGPTPAFRKVLETLQRDSAVDVAEFPTLEMAARLADQNLPPAVRDRLAGLVGGGGAELQKLHDSVEVWFNSGMDRISGTYKRHAQTMLFVIGLILSVAVNADTLDLWRRLSTDKQLRDGLAAQAVGTFDSIRAAQARDTARHAPPPTDTTTLASTDSAAAGGADTAATPSTDTTPTGAATTDTTPTGAITTDTTGTDTTRTDTTAAPPVDGTRGGLLASALKQRTPDQDHARLVLDSAMAALNDTQLRLGWTHRDAERLGVLVHRDSAQRVKVDTLAATNGKPARIVRKPLPEWRVQVWPWKWSSNAFWPKLIGLLITAFALSLGAPFWFDMLNKVINIRNAGRAPQERSKSPDAVGKRPAELPTR